MGDNNGKSLKSIYQRNKKTANMVIKSALLISGIEVIKYYYRVKGWWGDEIAVFYVLKLYRIKALIFNIKLTIHVYIYLYKISSFLFHRPSCSVSKLIISS